MYDTYYGDYWKIYLDRLTDRDSKQFIALKPGHTKFKDAEDRMKFNHEAYLKGIEKDSFFNHHDVKCIWSIIVDSLWKRDYLESFMLNWFGEQKKLGYWTSGASEVREYDQIKVNKWLSKPKERIQTWLEEEYRANIFTL